MLASFAAGYVSRVEFEGYLFPLEESVGTASDQWAYRMRIVDLTWGGTRVVESWFLDREDNTVACSKLLEVDGALMWMESDQLQAETWLRMAREGDQMVYRRLDQGGRVIGHHDLKPGLVVGPTLVRFVCERGRGILAGESVQYPFGAIDRGRAVDFELKAVTTSDASGAQRRIRMSASSPMVAAFAPWSRTDFVIDRDSGRVLWMLGRLPPLTDHKGDWRQTSYAVTFIRP